MRSDWLPQAPNQCSRDAASEVGCAAMGLWGAIWGLLVLATLVLGFLVGRWWVLVLPISALVAATVWNALTADANSEDTFWSIEVFFLAATIAAVLLVGLTVAFRRVLRRLE